MPMIRPSAPAWSAGCSAPGLMETLRHEPDNDPPTRSTNGGICLCPAITNRRRDLVQLATVPGTPICIDAEAVTGETWEHVQMDVEDLLKRGLPVRQEQVDSLAAKLRPA